jgi:hypothetical protein
MLSLKKKKARCSGSHLQSYLLRRQRSGVLRFETRIVVRLYLEKNPSQKRAGGVDQGVGTEFKLQYCKKNPKKQKPKQNVYMYITPKCVCIYMYIHIHIYMCVYVIPTYRYTYIPWNIIHPKNE